MIRTQEKTGWGKGLPYFHHNAKRLIAVSLLHKNLIRILNADLQGKFQCGAATGVNLLGSPNHRAAGKSSACSGH
jgi:hypothetical protein